MSVYSARNQELRVAIIGSGPSGFYAAEALLAQEKDIYVDMYERLPSPFGLVRSGVAPDHPKLKQPIAVYQQVAKATRFQFFGNVHIGRDLKISDLQSCYCAILFACGAQTDRKLGISGEDLPGVHSASEFIGWYNGHPDYSDLSFDLSHETVVVIGHGNVAVDVCRILAKTIDELKHTDIAAHALDVLAGSKIRNIYMIGRRGPAQAKFTHQELRELGELENCDPVVEVDDLRLSGADLFEIEDRRNRIARKSFEVLKEFSTRSVNVHRKKCHIQFLRSPIEICGAENLERVILTRNRLEGHPFEQVVSQSGNISDLPCGVLFRSIGYSGVAIPGVPFDERQGVIPNNKGRVTNERDVVPGLYVTGWIKRGPSGIIGTNRADSVETVDSIIADLPVLAASEKRDYRMLLNLLEKRNIRWVSYGDWEKIDAAEVKRGAAVGKPREKFCRVSESLNVLRQNVQAA